MDIFQKKEEFLLYQIRHFPKEILGILSDIFQKMIDIFQMDIFQKGNFQIDIFQKDIFQIDIFQIFWIDGQSPKEAFAKQTLSQ